MRSGQGLQGRGKECLRNKQMLVKNDAKSVLVGETDDAKSYPCWDGGCVEESK